MGPNLQGGDTLVINWDERKVFCNSCGRWIHHDEIWIDGSHDLYLKDGTCERSAHAVWERA